MRHGSTNSIFLTDSASRPHSNQCPPPSVSLLAGIYPALAADLWGRNHHRVAADRGRAWTAAAPGPHSLRHSWPAATWTTGSVVVPDIVYCSTRRECGTVCWLCWTLQYEYACFNKIAFPSSLSIPVTGCLAEPLFGEIQLIMTVAFGLALQSVSALMLRPISDQTPAARLMRLIHLLANFSQRTSPNESEIATPASITAVQAPIVGSGHAPPRSTATI